MARRATSFLPPGGSLDATVILWGRGEQLHRIHDSKYAGNAFNPSRKGNARFSPIVDPSGAVIPTLYAGTTLDCALMETIFHDVPFKAGFKPLSRTRMVGKVHSILISNLDLKLIDLGTIPLRRLGVNRAHLIDTTKAHYPETRQWAESLYAQFPHAQGLRWTSRQDDGAHAIMLFGNRIDSSRLVVAGPVSPMLIDDIAAAPVIDLAVRLGVTLVE